MLSGISRIAVVAAFSCLAAGAQAQTTTFDNALTLLVPFSVLGNTDAGKAALAANLHVTETIQNGTSGQPGLDDFQAQQAQALKDAFITSGNAAELADGLGSCLGGAYQAAAKVKLSTDGKPKFKNIAPSIGNLILYTATLTGADSNAGKYFFADEMQKIGDKPAVPVPADEAAILTTAGGTTDVLGKAYGLPAGAKGADPFGDSRPFQVNKDFAKYDDPDYFGAAANNDQYLDGPAQNLTGSPSFPSGHTTYGYTESLLLAFMVPERFPEMIVRGAEYGNSRIVVGAHYAMDVIAGRTLAYYDLAQLLSENPAYLGQKEGKAVPVTDYAAALKSATADLRKALAAGCGHALKTCAVDDSGRFKSPAVDAAFYESTQTYGLPPVYPAKTEDVATMAPEAGYLLTAAFPYLTLEQADHILTDTEGPGGGFLDDGSKIGVFSRLDLYKAGLQAKAAHKAG